MHRSRFAALVVFALLLVGCSEKGPARGPVKGRVTMGKQPVSGATVFFENAEAGVAMNAPLDADGNYEVKSYQGVGLPVGTYKVAVLPGGVMTADEQGPKAHEAKAKRPKPSVEIPEKYHKTASSGFTIEVKEGDNPPFNFDLAP
jgi:hypothetical protein